jgi:hypothetical protein
MFNIKRLMLLGEIFVFSIKVSVPLLDVLLQPRNRIRVNLRDDQSHPFKLAFDPA